MPSLNVTMLKSADLEKPIGPIANVCEIATNDGTEPLPPHRLLSQSKSVPRDLAMIDALPCAKHVKTHQEQSAYFCIQDRTVKYLVFFDFSEGVVHVPLETTPSASDAMHTGPSLAQI